MVYSTAVLKRGEEIMLKLPVIEKKEPEIVICGLPNSGKRFFLRSLLITLADGNSVNWKVSHKEDSKILGYYRKSLKDYGLLPPDKPLCEEEDTTEDFWEQPHKVSSLGNTYSEEPKSFNIQILPELSFSDSKDQRSTIIQHLMNTTGILFLVDPLAYILRPDEAALLFYQARPAEPMAENCLLNMIECLRAVECSGGIIQTPCVLVYTKRDLYNVREFGDNDEIPIELIQLHRIFDSYFSFWDIVYCSALGNTPRGGKVEFRPDNIIAPLDTIHRLIIKRKRG